MATTQKTSVNRWYQLQGYPVTLLSPAEVQRLEAEWTALINTVDQGLLSIRAVAGENHPLLGSPVTYYEFYLRHTTAADDTTTITAFDAAPADDPGKPKVAREHPDHLELEGGGVAQCAAVYGYPSVLPAGFLYSFFGLADEIVFAWEALDPGEAADSINKARLRLTDLASDPTASTATISKAKKVEELAFRANYSARLIKFHLLFTYSAESRDDLKARARLIKNAAKSLLLQLEVPRYVQDAVYHYNFTPIAGVEAVTSKIMDSVSAQAFYPLINEHLFDPEGIFLGVTADGSPVLWDPWGQNNYNLVVLGETGSGKSLTAKTILKRIKEQDPDTAVFGLDPEDEYVAAASTISPDIQAVSLAADKPLGLDPLRLGYGSRELTPADVAAILAEYYLPRDEQYEVQATRLRGYLGTYVSSTTKAGGKPDLFSFIEWLKKEEPTLASYLVGATTPPDSLVFQGEPPTSAGNIVYGLRAIEETKTGSAVRRRALVLTLLTLLIEKQLYSNHRRGVFFVDEAWLFVDYPVTMQLLASAARRARKYNKSFIFISQRPYDLAANQAGRTILEQAANTILFKQKEAAGPVLREIYGLRDEEIETLYKTQTGTGIMRSGQRLIRLTVTPTPDELKAFSTTGQWGQQE